MGASYGYGTRHRRLKAEMNVVPYIDVMLVLLVIFMITAPLLTQGVGVDLPPAVAAELPSPVSGPPSVLSVKADGQLAWTAGGAAPETVDEAGLQAAASALASREPEAMVQIQADRHVDYGHVAAAMGVLQAAGVRRMGFVTAPVDERAPASHRRAGGAGGG